MTNQNSARRNPVLWLVFILPAVSIVAGVGLLVTAIRTGGADAVSDPGQRTARAQVADLSPDIVAGREKLSAVVRVDAERGLIEALPASGRFERSVPLVLELAHPARAAGDRRFVLQPAETGWRSEGELDTGHDWNLKLAPEDGRWRLKGRLLRDTQAARVAPALPGSSRPPPDAPDPR